MKQPRYRLAIPLALAALLLSGATFFAASSPAEAQCLPQTECDALKAQLREFRSQAKADRHQLRHLRRQASALPVDSPEREALREQARALRQAARERRREARPVLESLRQGCRNC